MMTDYRLVRMYHPSLRVPDLSAAERFLSEVFGRRSTPLSTLSPSLDYSLFTPIADVLFDCIDPRRYRVDGELQYSAVDRPVLDGFGWYVDGIAPLFESLREHGFSVVDQRGAIAEAMPKAFGSSMPLFFTTPESAGLRYEFVPEMPFPLDHRLAEGWTLPEPSAEDPLGIVRCAGHVVRTSDPRRAERLFVDALGGTVVDRDRDLSVEVGGSTVVFETADVGPADMYHSLVWEVVDLDRVRRHLATCGVGVAHDAGGVVTADPATALGVPWRFVEQA